MSSPLFLFMTCLVQGGDVITIVFVYDMSGAGGRCHHHCLWLKQSAPRRCTLLCGTRGQHRASCDDCMAGWGIHPAGDYPMYVLSFVI